MSKKNKKTVSLVLGSGGARGLAHIGVIHWLEENEFKIESIAGCSIGALIGGIFAAGQLKDFEQWVRAITRLDIVSLLDFSCGKSGFIKGDKIINSLVDLIDGGVLNPVPIAPTFSDETEMTIAVNLGGPVEIKEEQSDTKPAPVLRSSPFQEKINRFIERFQQSETNNSSRDWGAYDIANQAFDAMQSTIARQKLAAYPPDRTIEIARNTCGTMEFDRASEMIELGYRRAQEYMAEGGPE